MQTIFDATLSKILPESIAGDKNLLELARSLDEHIKSVAADAKLTIHLPRLDELQGIILDVLAEQFHVDFYDSQTLTDKQKKNFIRQSIAHHRRKGTIAAVEEVCNQFFNSAQVEELGNFMFKKNTREFLSTRQAFKTFIKMLFDAKNVRSWLASIDVDLSPPKSFLYTGTALATDGTLDINLRKPKGSLTKIFAGNLMIQRGDVSIDPRRPTGSKMILHVGCPLIVTGHVLIDSKDKPARRVKENPVADLAIANVAIPRGNLLVADDPYDFIRIFFRYPDGYLRRSVTIKNPREDVTKEEIAAVGQYAVDNELLLNRAEDALAVQNPKASLVRKKITVLI